VRTGGLEANIKGERAEISTLRHCVNDMLAVDFGPKIKFGAWLWLAFNGTLLG